MTFTRIKLEAKEEEEKKNQKERERTNKIRMAAYIYKHFVRSPTTAKPSFGFVPLSPFKRYK